MMSTLGGFFASAQTCAGYVQPANEYVQNGGMEYFNNPCSSLNLNNAPYYPVCSWTYPLWQNASSVTASDYYNTCAPIPTTNVQAANSVNGNINRHNFNNGAPPTATTPLSPHSGNGYSGISVCQPTIGSDHREYITSQLVSTLQVGATYQFSAWVRLSGNSQRGIQNLSVLFSNAPAVQGFNAQNGLPITPAAGDLLVPLSASVITDRHNWTQVTASIVIPPGSSYQHITIGNFSDNFTTTLSGQLQLLTSPGNTIFSYYFIDDVSLTCECCTENFDASFWGKIADGKLSVNSPTQSSSHVWKVYSITNGTAGQYTHLGTFTDPSFSLDLVNPKLCYYVTHSIDHTPCGYACAAQIICGAECDEKECNLTPPTGLTVSRVGGQDFLSWNPVPGAISYTVEITPNDPRCCGQIDPGGDGWISAPLVFSNIFGTSHTVDNHTFEAGPGDVILTCYSWRVIAKCPDGGSVSSASTCSNGSAPGGSGSFIDKSNTGSVGPLSPEESSRLTIYPNPTNGMISFEVKTEKEDVYTITITDLAGKKIESFEQMKTNNKQLRITWDTTSLVAGEYLVTIVNSANEIMVKKFIKE